MSAENEELRIDDPEELSQKKRIKEILNRRKDVIDARIQAKDMWVAGELDQLQAVRLYQNTIQGMILDLRPKIKASDDVEGETLLKEKVIASVTVMPPMEQMPDSKRDFAAGAEIPEPKEVQIRGLEWFVNNDPVIERSFTVTTWNPPEDTRLTGRAIIGFDILDKALEECIQFIDDSGIDADMEQEEQQTKIDRELLEEVDGWRNQNVE